MGTIVLFLPKSSHYLKGSDPYDMTVCANPFVGGGIPYAVVGGNKPALFSIPMTAYST